MPILMLVHLMKLAASILVCASDPQLVSPIPDKGIQCGLSEKGWSFLRALRVQPGETCTSGIGMAISTLHNDRGQTNDGVRDAGMTGVLRA